MNNYKNLQIVKQGINVVIAGRPNVGKSTLINGLARRDVAIVSEEAGTTRDILQVPNMLFRLKYNAEDCC